jgi:hypothetical protein
MQGVSLPFVIASPQKAWQSHIDCFVASLLAMTDFGVIAGMGKDF